jgi:hypothetical protein
MPRGPKGEKRPAEAIPPDPEFLMRYVWLTLAVLLIGLNSWASAQVRTVERTAKAQSGKDVRVGAYINIQPDCTSGALPTIRLVNPPVHGKVAIKKAKANATNYKQCLAVEVPAYVAIYRSAPDFTGTDSFTVEVKYQEGRTEIQNITVTVGVPQKSI